MLLDQVHRHPVNVFYRSYLRMLALRHVEPKNVDKPSCILAAAKEKRNPPLALRLRDQFQRQFADCPGDSFLSQHRIHPVDFPA